MRKQKPKKNGNNSNSVKRKPKKQKKKADVKIQEIDHKIYSINTPYTPPVDIKFKDDPITTSNIDNKVSEETHDVEYEVYANKSNGGFTLVLITLAAIILLVGYLLV